MPAELHRPFAAWRAGMIALIGLFVIPQESPAAARSKTAEAAVLSVQAQIDAALAANDADALAPLLTDDATRTGVTGITTSKAQWLAQIRDARIRYGAVRRPPPEVRLYGPVAVVTGMVEIEVTKPGTGLVLERNRYLRVYARQKGLWRLAAHQATAITGP